MGQAGRLHVVADYSWSRSVELMEDAYQDAIADAGRLDHQRAARTHG